MTNVLVEPKAKHIDSLKDFLESAPPGRKVMIDGLWKEELNGKKYTTFPVINIHCRGERCLGSRHFRPIKAKEYRTGNPTFLFVRFLCSDCKSQVKTFCISLEDDGTAYKFGELPRFGDLTPPRLLRLLGDNKDLFLKGRRSENQSLGIAAFTYYRRVVENSKNEILNEIIKVASAIGGYDEVVAELHVAKREIQFSKAIDSVKHAIPENLLINGQNPLLLLHSALSVGVHELSDDDCLELAHDIRIILAQLIEKVQTSLRKETEISEAVKRLAKRKKERENKPSSL